MFVIEYKQAGIRAMSQELTQSVLAHYNSDIILDYMYLLSS